MERRKNAGFTLIELMVVITIIGLLAGVTSVAVMRNLAKAKVTTTKQNMRTIKSAIQMYYLDKNRIPSGLSELCGADTDEKRYIESEEPPKDAWGGEFQYTPRDKKNYDLVSLGSDGVEGGDGDAKDIGLADLSKNENEEEKP